MDLSKVNIWIDAILTDNTTKLSETSKGRLELLKNEVNKSNRLEKLACEKFAEALEEVKRIIDRMDIDIFDNESVGKDAYYQIHTSINEAKRQINEVISKFSR